MSKIVRITGDIICKPEEARAKHILLIANSQDSTTGALYRREGNKYVRVQISNFIFSDSFRCLTAVVNECEVILFELVRGYRGLPGPPGLPGTPGNSCGCTSGGSPGLPGKNGISGPPGLPGISCGCISGGSPGLPGKNGVSGSPGLPGKNGISGRDGSPGSPGKNGISGRDGSPGSPGKNGISGRDGSPGSPGKNGISGKDGLPGLNGLPGSPGKNGVSGNPGLPGKNGVSGNPGKNGVSGNPGKNGVSGNPGLNGLPGSPGKNGLSGNSGLPGKDGISGYPGLPGKNGISGSPGAPGSCECSGLIGAYAYVWNTISGDQQILSGCNSAPPPEGAIVKFNSVGSAIKNIAFDSSDTLTILEDGVYQAIYTVAGTPVGTNVSNLSFKLLQNSSTIPGSISLVGAPTNGTYQINGGSKFYAKAGDRIQLANNVIGPIQLAVPQLTSPIGAHGYGPFDGTVVSPTHESSATITPVATGSSIFICVQLIGGSADQLLPINITDNLNNTYYQAAGISGNVGNNDRAGYATQIWYAYNATVANQTLTVTLRDSISGQQVFGFEVVEILGYSTVDQIGSGTVLETYVLTGSVVNTVGSSKSNNIGLVSSIIGNFVSQEIISNGNSNILDYITIEQIIYFLDTYQFLTEGENIMSYNYSPIPTSSQEPTIQFATIAISINTPSQGSQTFESANNASLDIIRLD